MAKVFIDCEWIEGDYLTILGAYSYGQDKFQLYDETLTRRRFSRFLNICTNRSGGSETFLFCHGPDIGRIESFFDMYLKKDYYCINTITAFRTFTTFRDTSLGHLEEYFEFPRRYALTTNEMKDLWNSGNEDNRRIVLKYNWDDCTNLWRLVRIVMKEYNVTIGDLKRIAMH